MVTPTNDLSDFDYTARTTTQYVEEFKIQIAINGDFFGPVRDDGNATESGVDARGLTILDNVTHQNLLLRYTLMTKIKSSTLR